MNILKIPEFGNTSRSAISQPTFPPNALRLMSFLLAVSGKICAKMRLLPLSGKGTGKWVGCYGASWFLP